MSKVKKVFLHSFKKEILNSEKPCLVKFYSDTCYLCTGLESVFEEVSKAFGSEIDFYRVNTRVERRLNELFCGDGVPTLVYFLDGKGRELEWPAEPDPNSGYSFVQLCDYLTRKLSK
jgi:thioredoxin 1